MKKNDGVTYWQVSPSIVEEVMLKPEDQETLKDFWAVIKYENEEIMKKHEQNRADNNPPIELEPEEFNDTVIL
jgi:hypothetical protein